MNQIIPEFLVQYWEKNAPIIKVGEIRRRVPGELYKDLYRLLLRNEVIDEDGMIRSEISN